MKAKRAGAIHFWLDDDREIAYNESTDLSYDIYLEDEEDELIEIDYLVDCCMRFAKAIGFADNTVEVAFGRRQGNE